MVPATPRLITRKLLLVDSCQGKFAARDEHTRERWSKVSGERDESDMKLDISITLGNSEYDQILLYSKMAYFTVLAVTKFCSCLHLNSQNISAFSMF